MNSKSNFKTVKSAQGCRELLPDNYEFKILQKIKIHKSKSWSKKRKVSVSFFRKNYLIKFLKNDYLTIVTEN